MKPPKNRHKEPKRHRLQREPANQDLDPNIRRRPGPLARAAHAGAAALHEKRNDVARHEDARDEPAVHAKYPVARGNGVEDRADEAPDQEVVARGDEDGGEDHEGEGCCEGALLRVG